jgi:hypothetical protein
MLPSTSNIIASLFLRWIRSLGLVAESFLNFWKMFSLCVEIYILFSCPFVVPEVYGGALEICHFRVLGKVCEPGVYLG